MRYIVAFTLWILGATALATAPAPSKIGLNPSLNLKIVEDTAVGEGFVLRASDSRYEVVVRGVSQKNEVAAKQMAIIEFTNIKNLYSPHANPYRGQITSLVQCTGDFSPRTFDMQVGKFKVKALVAGANSRKLFGTCVPEEIAFWAQYFNFYDSRNKRFVEVRIYEKRNSKESSGLSGAVARFKTFGEKLFIEAAQ